MLIHELNQEQCAEVFRRNHLGRLACSRYDQPYVVPIHFAFDEPHRCVYAFSTIGQKIEWMRENPKVCLEIEEVSDKNHWTTVIAMGRYEEILQSEEEADARRRAELLFQQRQEWWLPAAGKLGTRERPAIVVYRIQFERVTGRRAARDVS
jgi:nitroimidazol reductase NimA-like FMN-containing flavoprotein (pyridoxamine 5'-phosphate oxidase superfamily)